MWFGTQMHCEAWGTECTVEIQCGGCSEMISTGMTLREFYTLLAIPNKISSGEVMLGFPSLTEEARDILFNLEYCNECNEDE